MDIKEALTRKLGPLPAWAWGAIGGGAILVASRIKGKGASGSGGSGAPLGALDLGGGTGTGQPSSEPPGTIRGVTAVSGGFDPAPAPTSIASPLSLVSTISVPALTVAAPVGARPSLTTQHVASYGVTAPRIAATAPRIAAVAPPPYALFQTQARAAATAAAQTTARRQAAAAAAQRSSIEAIAAARAARQATATPVLTRQAAFRQFG